MQSCAYRDSIIQERRKHRRFTAREGAFVATNDDLCLIGQITDISLGGMCFKYIATDAAPSSCELDIFLSNLKFYLKNIPYKIISNAILDPEVRLSSIPICRCGVKFVNLTEDKISLLLHLIDSHTLR